MKTLNILGLFLLFPVLASADNIHCTGLDMANQAIEVQMNNIGPSGDHRTHLVTELRIGPVGKTQVLCGQASLQGTEGRGIVIKSMTGHLLVDCDDKNFYEKVQRKGHFYMTLEKTGRNQYQGEMNAYGHQSLMGVVFNGDTTQMLKCLKTKN